MFPGIVRICIFDDPPLSVALDGSHDGIEHVLITKRLGKEVYGAMLHGANRHRCRRIRSRAASAQLS
jgi:hypothetical protein